MSRTQVFAGSSPFQNFSSPLPARTPDNTAELKLLNVRLRDKKQALTELLDNCRRRIREIQTLSKERYDFMDQNRTWRACVDELRPLIESLTKARHLLAERDVELRELSECSSKEDRVKRLEESAIRLRAEAVEAREEYEQICAETNEELTRLEKTVADNRRRAGESSVKITSEIASLKEEIVNLRRHIEIASATLASIDTSSELEPAEILKGVMECFDEDVRAVLFAVR